MLKINLQYSIVFIFEKNISIHLAECKTKYDIKIGLFYWGYTMRTKYYCLGK